MSIFCEIVLGLSVVAVTVLVTCALVSARVNDERMAQASSRLFGGRDAGAKEAEMGKKKLETGNVEAAGGGMLECTVCRGAGKIQYTRAASAECWACAGTGAMTMEEAAEMDEQIASWQKDPSSPVNSVASV